MSYDIFVNYSSGDANEVKHIFMWLYKNGVSKDTVLFTKDRIISSKLKKDKLLETVIYKCNVFVLFISKESIKDEWEYIEQAVKRNKRVLLVFLEDITIPKHLEFKIEDSHQVHFYKNIKDEKLKEIRSFLILDSEIDLKKLINKSNLLRKKVFMPKERSTRDFSRRKSSSSTMGIPNISLPEDLEISKDLSLDEISKDIKEKKIIAAKQEELPRYADFDFSYFDEDDLRKKPNVLKVEENYELEVSVRTKRIGIPFEKDSPLPIPKLNQSEDVTIMVTVDYEKSEFNIKEPVRILKLPPDGDSIDNAVFIVQPLKKSPGVNDLSEIKVRLYFEFNLIEEVTIKVEVVGKNEADESQLDLEKPIYYSQDRQYIDYLDFTDIIPREMNIKVSKAEGNNFLFKFLIKNEKKEVIAFTAASPLMISDLEDILVRVRKLWYQIAMSKAYTEGVEADKVEFNRHIRRLAEIGMELWGKLFNINDIYSSMYIIGTQLRKNLLRQDSVIQISLEKDVPFIFPWTLIYDAELPDEMSGIAPSLEGFWGYRYIIEQKLPRLPGQNNETDRPTEIKDALNLDFMIWKSFRNSAQQQSLIDNFAKQSKSKIQVDIIDSRDSFYDHMNQHSSHILYFYTHGYTRFRQADIGGSQDYLKIFKNIVSSICSENGVDSQVCAQNKRIIEDMEKEDFQTDYSWIKLDNGTIKLPELQRKIKDKHDCISTFVFLNMCESAQVIPSLNESFISFFLNRGAKSVLGTECPMTIEFAHPFAEEFLRRLLSGETVGMALLKTRRHFMQHNNPLGFAYTLFGLATVSFKPPLID